MTSMLLLVSVLAMQTPAAAPAPDAVAEAYYLFLQSRSLEQAGNVNGAIERAAQSGRAVAEGRGDSGGARRSLCA